MPMPDATTVLVAAIYAFALGLIVLRVRPDRMAARALVRRARGRRQTA